MPYDERYELELIRGIEEPRAWNITAEVRKRTRPTDIVLDVGCGTAFKILPVASSVKHIYGLDPNQRMREKAQENIRKENVSNMTLVAGVSECLPYPDNHFDVLTCIVAHQTPSEFHRVLKPCGWVVCEQFGEEDKRSVADCFGSDEQGGRGIFADYDKGELVEEHRREYQKYFSEVNIRIGRWDSYLSYEGLVLLLEQVPLVRNFDKHRDEVGLRRVRETLMKERGIHVFHERVLIEARK